MTGRLFYGEHNLRVRLHGIGEGARADPRGKDDGIIAPARAKDRFPRLRRSARPRAPPSSGRPLGGGRFFASRGRPDLSQAGQARIGAEREGDG
jgi:hypothetical protein